MRCRALVLVLAIAGCPDGGTDCIGDSPASFLDPASDTCIEVGDQDACQYCGGTHCVVGDARALDLAPCSTCAPINEVDCLGRAGCRASYVNGAFDRCLGTAPSGPVHDGACAVLGAQECSHHDNCTAWYVRSAGGAAFFDHCADEVPSGASSRADGI
jgi:hypothetical protein